MPILLLQCRVVNGGWQRSVEARLWIWRLVDLILLFAYIVPPSFMSYHAQFLALCFKQDHSIMTYNTIFIAY